MVKTSHLIEGRYWCFYPYVLDLFYLLGAMPNNRRDCDILCVWCLSEAKHHDKSS